MRVRRSLLAAAIAWVVATALLGGCAAKEAATESATTATTGTSTSTDAAAADTGASTTSGSQEVTAGAGAAVPNAKEIPAGQAFAEGGGYTAYTFREVWRKALAVARAWRSGAYLVYASGTYVDERGVPTMWQLRFVDAIPTDQILTIDIDPWGTVAAKTPVNTAQVTDLLQPGDAKIPFGIMDSDSAVKLGRSVMSTAHNLDLSNNPALLLSFSRDHTGPYWTYSVDGPSGSRVSAQVDALTGEGKVLGQ